MSVSMVEVMSPPTTARAMGARISAPAPRARNRGSMPPIMAKLVMRMGRSRTVPARMMAWRREMPSSRSRCRAWSTSRIAFLVTSPMSRIMPMLVIMDMLSPVTSSIMTMPTMDSGRLSMMVMGSLKLSNWLASTK